MHSGDFIDIIECSSLGILINDYIAQRNNSSEYGNDNGGRIKDSLLSLFVSFHFLFELNVLSCQTHECLVLILFLITLMQSYALCFSYAYLFSIC